ncbi:hypothetical protein T484DRAFT_1790959 [Baffinella frigidus]|nr:hypothetical protein T484DRAFT_1790959 [Cryptophyta sp. CCMP2293]
MWGYMLDAGQSVGQMPVDVQELGRKYTGRKYLRGPWNSPAGRLVNGRRSQTVGCDVCTATGRKYLRGPRGTGFVYVRDSFLKTLDPVMLDQAGATQGSHLGQLASASA